MRIVDDGDERFSLSVEAGGLVDEAFFAFEVRALEIDVECFTQDLEGIDIGVEGASYRGDEAAFSGLLFDGFLDDGFSGSGFPHQEAKSSLAGMDLEGVENFLLMRQQFDILQGKRVLVESEVVTDHGMVSFLY
jgi:hypothetical protein